MSSGLNFISPNVTEEDKEMFFGPLDGEEFIVMEENWTLAHILTAAGVFPSLTQARKNISFLENFIPEGFTILTRGKKARRKEMFILWI